MYILVLTKYAPWQAEHWVLVLLAAVVSYLFYIDYLKLNQVKLRIIKACASQDRTLVTGTCNSYYVCLFGQLSMITCPNGYLFDTVSCDTINKLFRFVLFKILFKMCLR